MIIAFEGVEGAGTTTQAKMLFESLSRKLGRDSVFFFREPGGTVASESIRDVIMDHDDLNSLTELLLFYAARAELIDKEIVPLWLRGAVIILDRYNLSSFAYQGVTLPRDIIKSLDNYVVGNGERYFPHFQPDLAFFLDLPVEEGLRRKEGGERNRLDNNTADFYKKVRENYIEEFIKNNQYIIPIGTRENPYHVHRRIMNIYERKECH